LSGPACRPRLADGNGLLDILERQMQLIRIELLRTSAKLHALQLMQQMLQPIILRPSQVRGSNHRCSHGPRSLGEDGSAEAVGIHSIG
jgi:hypothetical protein